MSRVKNIDVPITKVVCKTTREILYPSKDKLRQLYRSTFETTKDHDNQHYLTNHILTIYLLNCRNEYFLSYICPLLLLILLGEYYVYFECTTSVRLINLNLLN